MKNLELEYKHLCKRLDLLFVWADELEPSDERLSELATYINVLISGYIEARIRFLLSRYASRKAKDDRMKSFAYGYIDDWHQPSFTNLRKIVGYFDLEWRDTHLPDEKSPENIVKSAVDSIVLFRNRAAHGRRERRSIESVKENYSKIAGALDKLEAAVFGNRNQRRG
jgi:HEPN superfamily RiboL-PSP-like protein